MSDGTIADLIDAQIEQQGVSCITVSDGHVLTLTRETLEALLAKARATGRVVLFIQRSLPA